MTGYPLPPRRPADLDDPWAGFAPAPVAAPMPQQPQGDPWAGFQPAQGSPPPAPAQAQPAALPEPPAPVQPPPRTTLQDVVPAPVREADQAIGEAFTDNVLTPMRNTLRDQVVSNIERFANPAGEHDRATALREIRSLANLQFGGEERAALYQITQWLEQGVDPGQIAGTIDRVIAQTQTTTPLGWVEAIGRSLGSGVVGGFGASAHGIGLIGRNLGAEETGQRIQQGGQVILDKAEEIGPDEAYRGVATDLAGGVGSMGLYVGAGVPAALITRTWGKVPRAVATMGTAASLAGPAGASEAYQRAIDFGLPEETALEISLYGIPAGVVQVAPVGVILKAIPASQRARVAGQIRHVGDAAFTEFGAEGAGVVMQNFLEQSYNAERGLWDDALYQALIGAGAGGIIAGVTQLATRGRGVAPLPDAMDPTAPDPETGLPRGAMPADQLLGEDPETTRERQIAEAYERLQRDLLPAPQQSAGTAPAQPAAPPVDAPAAQPAVPESLQDWLDDPRTADEIRQGVQPQQPDPIQQWADDPATLEALFPPPPTGTRSDPVRLDTPADVNAGAEITAIPTPAQAEAGNYRKRHLTWQGFDVSIETEQGAERTGVDRDGKAWSVTMPAPYGDIKGTVGKDGDPLDVYIGPNPQAREVYVIDQIDPATAKFDEHKIMVGFEAGNAYATYLAAFSDGSGESRLGAITPMSVPQFKQWARNGKTKKPVSYAEPKAERRPAQRKPSSLFDFLAASGGIAPDPELTALGLDNAFVPGYGRLVRAGGMSLDRAREAAAEAGFAGYSPDAMSRYQIRDFLDMLDSEARKGKGATERDGGQARQSRIDATRMNDPAYVDFVRNNARLDLADFLREVDATLDMLHPEVQDRAIELVMQGTTPDEAVSQAFGEVLATVDVAPQIAAQVPEILPPGWDDATLDQLQQGGPDLRSGSEQGARPQDQEGAAPAAADGRDPVAQPEPQGGRFEPGAEGLPQQLIPGVAPVTQGERLTAQASRPMGPRRPQQEPGGLFGPERDQTDIFDTPAAAPAQAETSTESARTETPAPTRDTPDALAVNQRQDVGTPENPSIEGLGKAFGEYFASPDGGFKTILQARKFAADLLGGPVKPGTEAAKAVDEAVEFGAVLAAREIVQASRAQGRDDKTIFARLLDLNGRMPNLNVRTSTSVANQAYSTPLPLAFVASRLAGITKDSEVLEPSAGNGALLIEATPDKTTANEIEATRRDNLDAQGFNVTTGLDAADPASYQKVSMQGPFDVVIQNPPFGPVTVGGRKKKFTIDRLTTHEIDHAIVMQSLKQMKPDGSAVLIIGGVNKLKTGEARSDAYNGKAKREFFFSLYQAYNVVEHVTVSGDLYAKQGAAWPVDVIVIRGKGKSARRLPAAEVPRILDSWADVKELLDGRYDETAARPADGQAGGPARAGEPGGARADDAGGDRDVGGVQPDTGGGGRPDQDGRPAGLRAGSRGGQRGAPQPSQPAPDAGDQAGDGGAQRAPARADAGVDLDALFDDALDDVFGAQEPAPAPTLSVEFSRTPQRNGGGWNAVVRYDGGAKVGYGKTKAEAESDARKQIPSEAAPPARTAGQAATSAAANTAGGLRDIAAGLNALFDPKGRIGSGPTFDAETYAKAKPMFVAGVRQLGAAGRDIADVMKALVRSLADQGLTRAAVENMRPYLTRFVADVQRGEISLDDPSKAPTPAKTRAPADQSAPSLFETESQADTAGALEGEAMKKPKPRRAEEKIDTSGAQVAYRPRSNGKGMNTLVPVNMQTAVSDALADLEKRVGDIDAYVARELGMTQKQLGASFGAEQIDGIALAIDNFSRNAGFILGDQTGIGKGRQVAAILRWSIKNGKIPIFVTEKPTLYADMYRDLVDVGVPEMLGRDIKMLMTNSGESVPLTDDGSKVLKSQGPGPHSQLLMRLAAAGKLDGYDIVFTTYAQMQTVKGQPTVRMDFLRAMAASNGAIVMDESHNAGGQKATGRDGEASDDEGITRASFARELTRISSAVLYSSATYAKRPDVMDLYAKTDMRLAVDDISKLGELIARGGVPMQQIVATMLSKAGQYVRRERSFDGIRYDTPTVSVDRRAYENFSSSIKRIQDFSENHVSDAVKAMSKRLKDEAKSVSPDNATGGAGASSTNFTSVMHNVINQMLLTLTADQAADRAIDALKNGEKPVVTVASTLESFLKEYADEVGITIGDAINVSANDLLLRYLERSRMVTVKPPNARKGESKRIRLTDADLGPAGVRAYRQAKSFIEASGLDGLPISPIDWIRHRIRQAGYTVSEITGRDVIIDYGASGATLSQRQGAERTIRGKRKAITDFNSGALDVMILNQSGSTGLSLHASEKVADKRPRVMIIAQAEANIDTHMQMLGRVNRTGQVVLPRYEQLVADVPATKRPASVLAKKMASLNANTTGARSSAVTAKDVPDFMNVYGDQVAAMIMTDNPDLHAALGDPLNFRDGSLDPDEAMRKVTGRIPLLPLEQQESLYEMLEGEYAALIEQMEATGQNALEAKTLDLDAVTTAVEIVRPATGVSPFAEDVSFETMDVKMLGKPMSSAQVLEKLQENLASQATSLRDLAIAGRARSRSMQEEAERDWNAYVRETLDDLEPDKRKAQETRLDAIYKRWNNLIGRTVQGFGVKLMTSDGNFYGVVLEVKRTGKTKNPLALGSWKATIALADSARQVTLPFSQLYTQSTKPDNIPDSWIEIQEANSIGSMPILDAFDDMQTERRETRVMVTGNLLAGYEVTNAKGTITNFVDREGRLRQGILMKRDFDLSKFNETAPVRFNIADHVVQFLERTKARVDSTDGLVGAALLDSGDIRIETDAGRGKGGRYYLDKGVLAAAGRDFVKGGGRMRVDLPPTRAVRVLDALKAAGAVFETRAHRDVAKKITGEDASGSIALARRREGAGASDVVSRGDTTVQFVMRPQFVESLDRLEGELRTRLDGLGLSDVGVRLVEKIRFLVEGKGFSADGAYMNRLVSVALDSSQDATAVLDHEAIHALKRLGFFTDKEWSLLERKAAEWVKRYNIAESYADVPADVQLEEGVAHAFSDWRAGRLNQAGIVAGVFRRIRAFFERLGNALRGLGFTSAEDVFGAVDRGEVGARNPRAMREAKVALARPPAAMQRQAQMQNFIARGQPLDRVMRIPFDVFGGMLRDGSWAPGARLFASNGTALTGAVIGARMGAALTNPVGAAIGMGAGRLIGGKGGQFLGEMGAMALGGLPGAAVGGAIGGAVGLLLQNGVSARGRFGWMHQSVEAARAGLIDRYGLSEDYIKRERKRGQDERAILMGGVEILQSLKEAAVGTPEAKVLQAVLTGEDIGDADMQKLAAPIREAIDGLGQEAVALGLVSPESYERNRATYLHRVYMKDEQDQNALARFVNKAMTSRRKRIIGDQFKGRGIFVEVDMPRLVRDDPAWAEARRGKPLKGEKFTLLEYSPGVYTDAVSGAEREARSTRRVYWPADKALPAKYKGEGWRERGTWEIRGQDKGKLVLWRDYTKAEREKMGEIFDARYTIGRTYMLMSHDLATGRFYKDIAENEQWTRTMEPEAPWKESGAYNRFWNDPEIQWVRVSSDTIAKSGGKKRWGALAGKWVRAEIWRDINEIDVMSRPSTWRRLLTQWKLNKALALDTPIPTASGWTTMGAIKVGDSLFDENGQPCTVLEVKDVAHGRPCYEVAFSDGSKIVADEDHWWFTKHRNKGGGVRTTKEISETLTINHRGEAAHSIPVAKALVLNDADLPVPAYALGLWLGDGHSGSPRITVGARVLDEITAALLQEGVHRGPARADPRSSAVTFTIDMQPVAKGSAPNLMRAACKALGVMGDKSIPQSYLRAGTAQRWALLRGLMDADGWITARGTCGFATSLPDMRDGVLELLRTLGYKPTCGEIASASGKPAWRIHFQAYADDPLFSLTEKASRLRQRPARPQRSGNRQIVAITPVASVPVRCISVSSESRLYLAGDAMVPTHNTARSPVVHMNNVMSNVMFMDMANIRMQDLYSGVDSWFRKDRHYDEALQNGAFGADMMSQEIRDNVLKPILDELRGVMLDEQPNSFTSRARMMGRIADRIWGWAKIADRKMVDAYRIEDELFRMATYRRRIELGDTPADAATFAREQFLDYDIRAPWVNAARNSVLPFLSYTYRAVPLIARSIAHHPWKLPKYFLIAYMANALAYMWDDDEEAEGEERERLSMREDQQGYTWVGVPRMIRMPWRDENGLPVFIDVRRWVPAGDVFDLNQGQSAVPIPAPLQFGGPLMLGAELALNKQAFTGREITNSLTDDWWDTTWNVGDWATKSWLPSAAWVPNSWYWTRISNAIWGATDARGQPYSVPQALVSSVGIKIQPQDVEDGLSWRDFRFRQVERELRRQANAASRRRERGLISEAAFNREMTRLMKKMENLAEQAQVPDRPTPEPR